MKNITLYTKDYCPYCKGAKKILADRGFEYTEIDVEFDLEARQEMVLKSGRTTVPQIFFDNTHIGGYDDLIRHFSKRKAA